MLNYLKCAVVATFVGVFVMVHLVPPMDLNMRVACVKDVAHDLTTPSHIWLTQRPELTEALKVTSQLWTDLILLCSLWYWLYNDNSWRFPLSVSLVFLSCQVTRQLYALRAPEMCEWTQSTLPSLLVWYGCLGGSFFNLQIAVLTVCYCQQRSWGSGKSHVVVIGGIAMQVYLLIILRGCYWIDILGALIVGELCYFVMVRLTGTSEEERPSRCAHCQKELKD